MIRKSPHVSDRRDFGAFANFHGATLAVEVGVDQGNFAAQFMSQWRGDKMYLVDPYLNTPGSFMHDREWDMQCVMHNLGRHRSRCRFIRAKSVDAFALIRDKDRGQAGFVYIDGDHSYAAVKVDLPTWWPMVRGGGIFAGHDWNWEGVAKAVTEFAEGLGLDIYYTHEQENKGPSWYIL